MPFLEEHDQLQTNGISKRFDVQRRDYTQIVKKKKSYFFAILKEHDQLQTNGISKRFDAQRRDYTQIVDFSMKIEMLINFVLLSK